jgi:hypothetical protein
VDVVAHFSKTSGGNQSDIPCADNSDVHAELL